MQATSTATESREFTDPVNNLENMGRTGRLIINADDWGRDVQTTDRTLDCVHRGTISSVSAMVYMEDSERAADIAKQEGIDAGLHLNFTSPFSCSRTPEKLKEHQRRTSEYLSRSRLTQALFQPTLAKSFGYVAAAQVEEFRRLYGVAPQRVDGHHHMHLCANVVFGGLLPRGVAVRRSFSFEHNEKGFANRWYRKFVDQVVSWRHPLTDYFFSLEPLETVRLRRIFGLGKLFTVEVETHPVNPEEYGLLTSERLSEYSGECPIADRYLA